MLCDFLASLASLAPKLKTSIVVIFIANEENSSFHGIGVDQLAIEGYMGTKNLRLLPFLIE